MPNYLSSFQASGVKVADISAGEIMITRGQISAFNIEDGDMALREFKRKRTFTRTLVYRGELDNILGYVHIKDVTRALLESNELCISSILRQHIVAPKARKISALLEEMQLRHIHIAVIIDEYGAAAGIVTLDDILAAIIGPVEDETSISAGHDYKVIEPGVIVLDAALPTKNIETLLDVNFEQTNKQASIASLVLAKAGHVPKIGEVIEFAGSIRAEVVDASDRKLKTLKISRNETNLSARATSTELP